MFKKGDFLLIVVLLFLSLAVFVGMKYFNKDSTQQTLMAIIKQSDKELYRINLDTVIEPRKINIEGAYPEVILVEKGRIRFLEAKCPDKLCVSSGWMHKQGQSTVCLPNKTLIKIEGENKNLDGVAY